MPTYGPWVQPADATVALGVAGSALIESESLSPSDLSTAADGAGEFSHESYPPAGGASDGLAWTWRKTLSGWTAAQALGVIDLTIASQFPPVPPSSGDLAQPHVTGYELETAYGVSLGSGILQYTINSADGWSLLNLSPSELIAFRVRVGLAPSYTYPPADFFWWGSLSTLLDIPTGSIGTVVSTGSFTYGDVLAFGAACLQQLTLVDWAATPTAGGPGAVVGGSGSLAGGLQLVADYRPPRYRLVYDTAAPLRQFPRDDGLTGMSGPRQRQPSSVQASERQRPAGYL